MTAMTHFWMFGRGKREQELHSNTGFKRGLKYQKIWTVGSDLGGKKQAVKLFIYFSNLYWHPEIGPY